MSEVFLKIVNMSISASWLVLAVLVLRLVLKKAPKWVSVLLWGFVAIRLLLPFSLESVFSLIPNTETISPEIMLDYTPEIDTGIGSLNGIINPVITEAFQPQELTSINPLQIWIPLAAILWLTGIAAMLLYTAISYLLLRRKVATAVRLRDNIFQSENVATPFVLGIIKPKIYLPFQMDEKNMVHVVAHEEAHIRRKDHWWKPVGFLLLAIHWFNPLMWLGYVLLCRDIELACDEKVIREMDSETKADYTQALVVCSVSRRSIAACPLAFGEVGVKDRVKSVMNYKKPDFWIILIAILLCVAVAVCFLTNPAAPIDDNLTQVDSADIEPSHMLWGGSAIAEKGNWVSKPESRLDAAIATAVLSRAPQVAEGMLQVESHLILGLETTNGTPLQEQTKETTVFLYSMVLEFEESKGVPQQPDGIYGYGILTFETDETGTYELKSFLDPKLSADYDEELLKRFAQEAEKAGEDEQSNKVKLFTHCQLIASDCIENRNASLTAEPGGVDLTPVIDRISYDINGDGEKEICTLTGGPTSGLFSFYLNVFSEDGAEHGKIYSEVYVLIGTGVEAPGELSFHVTKENLQLKAVEESYGGETTTTVYFDLVWQYGEVVLREVK